MNAAKLQVAESDAGGMAQVRHKDEQEAEEHKTTTQ